MSKDDAEDMRLDIMEDVSNELDASMKSAAERIAAYLEKTLDGIVVENTYSNEKAKAFVHDILIEDIYIPIIMKRKANTQGK